MRGSVDGLLRIYKLSGREPGMGNAVDRPCTSVRCCTDDLGDLGGVIGELQSGVTRRELSPFTFL